MTDSTRATERRAATSDYYAQSLGALHARVLGSDEVDVAPPDWEEWQRRTSWRVFLALLRAATAIAPPGTRRDRWLRAGLRAAVALRRGPSPRGTAQSVFDADYEWWLRAHALSEHRVRELRAEAVALRYRPLVSILTPVHDPDPAALAAAIDSVRSQLYDVWELCIVDDASSSPPIREMLAAAAEEDPRIKLATRESSGGISAASNDALALAEGELVGLLDHDDQLKADALLAVVRLLNDRPEFQVVYSDEDKREPDGRLAEAYFKSDWSPDLFLSNNYLGHFTVVRRDVLDEVGSFRSGYDGAQDYDLLLRISERTTAIGHVTTPLYTWRKSARSAASSGAAKPWAHEAGARALADALARRGLEATVDDGSAPGIYRIRYPVNAAARVAIVIPTRDRVDLLRRCIASVRERSSFRNVELVVVDNESTDAETLAFLSTLEGRVIRAPGPFNFSRLLNEAAAQVECAALLFLNNDTEVLVPGWIEALLEHGLRPEVGAVGARLRRPDGRPQHEGIAIGLSGAAGNLDHGGYFALGDTVRDCSAVTAACMLTRREVFVEVGGFDESMPIAFNDVDYCLRLRERGYRVIYTPYAELWHDEGASRGHSHTIGAEATFERRWGGYRDPFYNPNFSRKRPFRLRVTD